MARTKRALKQAIVKASKGMQVLMSDIKEELESLPDPVRAYLKDMGIDADQVDLLEEKELPLFHKIMSEAMAALLSKDTKNPKDALMKAVSDHASEIKALHNVKD